jgi:hypothetical protein
MPEISRTCGECKHWGRPGAPRRRFEVCTAIGGKEAEPPTGVQAYFSNPDAWFLTAADFACALFEQRSEVHPRNRLNKQGDASGELADKQVTAGQPVYLWRSGSA